MTAGDAPVITGFGTVCALGVGNDAVMAAALAGRSGIGNGRTQLEAEGYEVPERTAAAAVPWNGKPILAGETSRSTVYATTATAEALASAGIISGRDDGTGANVDLDRVGVVTGSAAPSADLYFGIGGDAARNGLGSISGRTAPNLSAGASAATIALGHGFRGPNFAVSAACATGALVVAAAADQLAAGRADVVIAVATESAVTCVGLESFQRAGALADVCQPFDVNRRGIVFGEGAAAIVIESAAHARARGAVPLARVLGSALTDDAHHMWAPEVGSWARTMELAIANAGITTADIDYVAAHAAGTGLGDATEVAALAKALGPRADEIPVWSTKGMHGHALGAAGAIEVSIAVQALRAGRVPQTVGLDEPDPACPLDHVPDPGRTGGAGIVLKDSFGFGGTNCVLVLEVTDPEMP